VQSRGKEFIVCDRAPRGCDQASALQRPKDASIADYPCSRAARSSIVDLWVAWTALLQHLLQLFAVNLGVGSGLAIILLTLALRSALLPLTWSVAYRAAVRQEKLARLQPQLTAIRERYVNDPSELAARTLQLYRQHGIKIADAMSLLTVGIQLPVLWGLYRVLRDKAAGAFLWVRDLGRPDALLAVLAALTTAVAMAAVPHGQNELRAMLLLLPALLCFMTALHFSAGLALYWTTSNLFGAVQTVALQRVLRRQ
jgi:YidC/Oxa1 family membrane protein insertase